MQNVIDTAVSFPAFWLATTLRHEIGETLKGNES